MKKDLAPSNVSNEAQAPKTLQEDKNLHTDAVSKKTHRNRKRKNYGDDFEQMNDDEDSSESEENERSTPSPALKESNGTGKKTKKISSSSSGKENRKKQRVSHEEKEKHLNICSQHDELVITQILGDCPEPEETIKTPQRLTVPMHPHFGGKTPKQHRPPKCISVLCREEKEELMQQLEEVRRELDETKKELSAVRAMQPSSSVNEGEVKYGKVPRSVGVAKNWEEISNGVWCCPVKVKAAIKNSATRTALALALFAIFYPKEELKGRRLRELDADIIDAITDFSLIAKLTKEPPKKKVKDGEEPKPASPVSRSGIKQALRLKCNSVISLQKKKANMTSVDYTTAD